MKKQISIEGKDRKEGLWGNLSKTRKKLRDRINSAISGKNVVDEQLLDEIEEILFTSDMGI